jgi:hypothetical protein
MSDDEMSDDDSTAGGDTSVSATGDMEEGEEHECMENNYEAVRANAVTDLGDEEPLCFAISTIFEDPAYLSEMSDPICMYRCSWEDDCNYYMEFDEDDFKEFEYEVCAGMDVEIETGCYDMGFCDTTGEARDWVYWMWPYDAENEEEAQWFEDEGMYYWIPTVHTSPPGCQLEYELKSVKNLEWDWDPWCAEDDWEETAGGSSSLEFCQSVQFWPTLLAETSRAEIYFKVRVTVSGTNTYKDFYQFFKWDWEYYNEMANYDFAAGGEFDCPPDFPECMDEWYYYYDQFYYMDDYYMDMEPPSFEDMNEWFMEEEFPNFQFTEDAYNYLMENMDSEPGTDEFDQQF